MAAITHTVDVLVIGTGFAGNRAALGAASGGADVLLATLGGGGSPNIMGFGAPVVEGDSVDVIHDDLTASGLGMNVPALTRVFVEATAELVPDCEALGVPFRKDDKGDILPLHSLGTTFPRLVIQYQCLTGQYIQRALNERIRAADKITVRTNTLVTDILTDRGRVVGACALDTATGELLVIRCRAIVLAAGGTGRIHDFSTYPKDVTGDSMAMAYRAGLRVMDMELLQFEPCCFVAPEAIRGYVNPTTFLKMGAQLTNSQGRSFVTDYATIQKDVLSRAIQAEITCGRGTPNGGVWYDVRMLPEEVVKVTHYVHYEPARVEGGIDICREVSEVAPAGHSFQGGVVVNPDCSTAVTGLYVAGEAMGGVHGANRMGGDAGGAALVFGKIAGRTVAEDWKRLDLAGESTVLAEAEAVESLVRDAAVRKEDPAAFQLAIQKMMQDKVGLIKTEKSLASALAELDSMDAALDGLGASGPAGTRAFLSARNMLLTARMMALCARERTESRGVHYREDFPQRDDAKWSGRNVMVARATDGSMRAVVQDQE